MSHNNRIEIAAIPKGNNAEVRVAIDRMGKNRVLDIRLWYRRPHIKEQDPMIPTRRGVTVGMDKAAAIAAAILQAVEYGARHEEIVGE